MRFLLLLLTCTKVKIKLITLNWRFCSTKTKEIVANIILLFRHRRLISIKQINFSHFLLLILLWIHFIATTISIAVEIKLFRLSLRLFYISLLLFWFIWRIWIIRWFSSVVSSFLFSLIFSIFNISPKSIFMFWLIMLGVRLVPVLFHIRMPFFITSITKVFLIWSFFLLISILTRMSFFSIIWTILFISFFPLIPIINKSILCAKTMI
jgi:hypothetical protein